jgi:hypothetical protein
MDRCSGRCLDDLHAVSPGCGENVTGAVEWSFLIHHRSYWDAFFGSPENVTPNSNYANAYNSGTLLGRFIRALSFFAALTPYEQQSVSLDGRIITAPPDGNSDGDRVRTVGIDKDRAAAKKSGLPDLRSRLFGRRSHCYERHR